MDKEEGEVIEEGDENGYVNNTVFRNMELGPLSEFIANNGEITLGKDIIKFYEHSFYQNDIDEILSNWDNILSFQYHTYLKTQDDVELKILINYFTRSKGSFRSLEIPNILCAIACFEINWRNEFEFSFTDEFIEPMNIEIIITPHGNVRETQQDPIETSNRINQLKNTKYVVPLANMGTIAYHLPSVSSLMHQGLSKQSKGVVQPLSSSKKKDIRNLYAHELANYKDYLQTKKKLIEKNYDLSDDNEYDEFLRETDWINKDITHIDNATKSGSKSILKTLTKESLNTLNTQLKSMKSNEVGNPHDYGIIVIPNQSDEIAILFLKFCEEKMKITPIEPDRDYYANLFNFCVTKLIDKSGQIQTNELFETIISLKNKNAFYAFNMQKTGLIGSFIYEIVKKIVMQGENKNVERLFFSNFSVDHLGTNIANNVCSSFTRTANRGFFIVEMLRILEIMDIVGPNNIIVGSCQTTTGNVDLLNCAIEETREFTQNSQNYSPTHPIYIPNSPQYSPTSPIYIPTLSKPLDEMTIDELSFEGQLAKRPQSHRNKRFDRKYNKTQKQHRHVGKIKGREIYGIDGERGYYVIENGNYVKIKIDKYKKELSFRSKKNNLREYKSNNAKTASIHKMLEMSRGGQKTRKVCR